jgi:hypothetical protein
MVGLVGWVCSGPLAVARVVPRDHSRWTSRLVQGGSEAMDASATSGKDPSGARTDEGEADFILCGPERCG